VLSLPEDRSTADYRIVVLH